MSQHETKLKSHVIFTGKVVTLNHDDVLLPDGSTAKREVVHHPGGVCIAALQGEDIYMISQYRYSYDEQLLELPAGKLEQGELPEEAIRREMLEEVGAHCTDWKDMGKLYPTPGYCNEIIHLYACRIESIGEQNPDEDEFLEVEFIPLDKAVDMVMAGELPDSKTQTLVLKLAELMRRGGLR